MNKNMDYVTMTEFFLKTMECLNIVVLLRPNVARFCKVHIGQYPRLILSKIHKISDNQMKNEKSILLYE